MEDSQLTNTSKPVEQKGLFTFYNKFLTIGTTLITSMIIGVGVSIKIGYIKIPNALNNFNLNETLDTLKVKYNLLKENIENFITSKEPPVTKSDKVKKWLALDEAWKRQTQWGRWNRRIWIIDTVLKSIFLSLFVRIFASVYIEEDERELSIHKMKFDELRSGLSDIILNNYRELYIPHTRALISYQINTSETILKHSIIKSNLKTIEEKIKQLEDRTNEKYKKCNSKKMSGVFLKKTKSDYKSLIENEKNLLLILRIIMLLNDSLKLHYSSHYKESYDTIFSIQEKEIEALEKMIGNYSKNDKEQSILASKNFREAIVNFYNFRGICARVISTRDPYNPNNPCETLLIKAKENCEKSLDIRRSIDDYNSPLTLSNLGFILHDLSEVEKLKANDKKCTEACMKYRQMAYDKHFDAVKSKAYDYTDSAVMNGMADALLKVDLEYLSKTNPNKYSKIEAEKNRNKEILEIYKGIEDGNLGYGGPGFFTPVMRLNRAIFYMKTKDDNNIDEAINDIEKVKDKHGHERRDVYLLSAKAHYKKYAKHHSKPECQQALEDIKIYLNKGANKAQPNTYENDKKSEKLLETLETECGNYQSQNNHRF